MALFGKKKSKGDEGEDAPQDGAQATAQAEEASGAAFTPSPEKSRTFFEYAKQTQDMANYEYAMTLWLKGMAFDPTDMNAFEGFLDAALSFGTTSKGPTKDQLKTINAKGEIGKYLMNLLQWGCKRTDWALGLKTMESAAKLDLAEQIHWMGTQVMGLAMNDKKAKKSDFVTMMRTFEAVEAYDKAVEAGDHACKLDPSDAKLSNEVKNMSAQATMSRGGYDNAGVEGGFRSNVKDLDKQRELEEEESFSKSADAKDRIVERVRMELEERPDDGNTIQKFAKVLLERGNPNDEKLAYKTLMHGYQVTGSYKFKENAGEIEMRVARRKVRELQKAGEHEKFERAKVKLLELEIREYEERARAYPTSLKLKYELGKRYLAAGRNDEAISELQKAKDAGSIAVLVRAQLAKAFISMGWLDSAESTYREALAAHPLESDETGLALRYGLMEVLAHRAKDEDDTALAQEAYQLASSIAMNQIDYRDVRQRREELSALVKALKA